MASVAPDYRIHNVQTSHLIKLIGTLTNLPSVHQKLVAELIIIRLFSLLENIVSAVSAKLASGAIFMDGTNPALLANARSSQDARKLFQAFRRTRPRHQLQWTTAREIKENVRHVIDARDNFIYVIDRNASMIDEIRRVRNRIAHNNSQSRKNYREVVRRYYGAYLNSVTPGNLLLSPRFSPCLLIRYVKMTRILARDLVRA